MLRLLAMIIASAAAATITAPRIRGAITYFTVLASVTSTSCYPGSRCYNSIALVRLPPRNDGWDPYGTHPFDTYFRRYSFRVPSYRPERMQHFLKPATGAAGAEVVAAEFLAQLLVAMDDSATSLDLSFAQGTPGVACPWAQKECSESISFVCLAIRPPRWRWTGNVVGQGDG